MPRIIASFKDPVRRPRYIVWSAVVALGLIVVMIVGLGTSSTVWFCSQACHKVQDDTITAYEHSPHSEISCMACHMPVGAGPVTFLLHKMGNLGELPPTITNSFSLPLNAHSHLALESEEMGSEQCTQCHDLDKRRVTPSEGVIIDHAVHSDKEIRCTACHNRTAHVEDFELTLTDPRTGAQNQAHEDFMLMEGCFRCHTQSPSEPSAESTMKATAEGEADAEEPADGEGGTTFVTYEAPGACDACHPEDFELRPESHFQAGFYKKYGESGGHAELAKEDRDYCGICHNETTFCEACHGLPIPHADDFKTKHGEIGKKSIAVCANCHNKSGKPAKDTEFCNNCHHQGADPTKSWVSQHFVFVRQKGAGACFECHDPTYCAECHVRGIVR